MPIWNSKGFCPGSLVLQKGTFTVERSHRQSVQRPNNLQSNFKKENERTVAVLAVARAVDGDLLAAPGEHPVAGLDDSLLESHFFLFARV